MTPIRCAGLLSRGLVFLLIFLHTSFAQQEDTTEQSNNLIILPIVSYAPETKLALGVYGAYYFRPEADEAIPASVVRVTIAYTTRKQFQVSTAPDIYISRWRFGGEISFTKFADKFYGIGNSTLSTAEEEYTSRRTRINLRGLMNLFDKTKAGIIVDFEDNTTTEFEAGKQLSGSTILGSAGGTTVGYGIVTIFDSRDHTVTPSSGTYSEASATFFPKSLGSDFGFSQFAVDARPFFPLFGEHVLGFNAYGRFNSGSPPFQRLAALGGPYRMRGLYEGRFRDKHMLEFQTEYRLPLFWKLGLVGFVGAGDVASSVGKFVLSNFKYSAGAGLRYLIAPKEKVNIRFDLAFASDNSSSVYLTIEEAF